MAVKKYINTMEVVELTGRPYDEILNLVSTGVLPAHKSRRGRWRLNVDAVEQYFGILINNPKEDEKLVVTKPQKVSKPAVDKKSNSETRLIINENHYQDVIQRICTAKSSIKIMTANFKRFRLKPTDNQGEGYKDGTPFVKYLMAKAVQGISVQIICSRPSSNFTDEWEEYYRQMNPSFVKEIMLRWLLLMTSSPMLDLPM